VSEPVAIDGVSVLFVMAAEAEYGPHLRKLFAPLICGVGPVEAAVSLSAKLAGLEAQNRLPDLVLSLGSAGSRTLEQTGIYQVSHVLYRDMDASALGFPKGQTPFLDLPPVVELPCPFPDLPAATLATGASVVSGAAYDGIPADMVDMETYGLLRAAQKFDVLLIGLRGISDGARELRHVDDWRAFLHVLDEKLAGIVEGMGNVIGAFRRG
jgi:adenosylhomocysteine nucleosidase